MPSAGYGDGQIYVCGGEQVFLIDADAVRADPSARVWSWRAGDSPEIAPPHRSWFRAMDECKPVMAGKAVLAASSSAGGVALIRRADKKCLFYAGGRNAHSAELLPGELLAGAFSYRSDQLRLYRLDRQPLAAEPIWQMELAGAHGVVWDQARSVLWALGNAELLKLEVAPGRQPAAKVIRRWTLPTPGGHDLFPLDDRRLAVTVGRAVYQFDAQAESFSPLPALARLRNVKSVGRHPVTGQIICTQGRPFTDKIHVLGRESIVLEPEDLYKARWNAHNHFSYGP